MFILFSERNYKNYNKLLILISVILIFFAYNMKYVIQYIFKNIFKNILNDMIMTKKF